MATATSTRVPPIQAEVVAATSGSNNKKDAVAQLNDEEESVFSKHLAAASKTNSTNNSKNSNKTAVNNNDENHHKEPEEEKDEELSSLWDLIASCSVVFLWFQRSTFGVLGLLKSLFLGHCLSLLFQWITGGSSSASNESTSTASSPSAAGEDEYRILEAIQGLLAGKSVPSSIVSAASSSSSQVESWPPPALVALAILTVVALVVHPDGMTWIMLRTIRYVHYLFVSLLFPVGRD